VGKLRNMRAPPGRISSARNGDERLQREELVSQSIRVDGFRLKDSSNQWGYAAEPRLTKNSTVSPTDKHVFIECAECQSRAKSDIYLNEQLREHRNETLNKDREHTETQHQLETQSTGRKPCINQPKYTVSER